MESIQEGRGYGVNTGGKGLGSQYRREGVMESIQEGRGYGVNTGGKGLWSQYRREGVMKSVQVLLHMYNNSASSFKLSKQLYT